MSLLPATGAWHEGIFSFPMRVYYEDTDLGGMVYHGRYVSFFERVRTESIRGTVLDVDALQNNSADEGGPLLYVVRGINITYHRQANVGDVLIGHSMVKRLRAAAVEAKQWINRGDELVAEAELTIAIISMDGRPRRWPEAGRRWWQEKYEKAHQAGHI